MRGERRYLPDRCRAPQGERTPLHCAAHGGSAAVAGQLLAAKADVEAQDTVRGQRGQWGVDREGVEKQQIPLRNIPATSSGKRPL